ncbi:MAG TPA: hypothetical protein VIT65_00035 [Microlunatus sp.]
MSSWRKFPELVEDDGSVETVVLQQAQVQPVVRAALPSSATASVAIVVEVLGEQERRLRRRVRRLSRW